MDQRMERILIIFEGDMGGRFTHNERVYAERKWEALDPESRMFLNSLSEEDLENICIGERRGENDVLYRGSWQPLPAAVDSFLNDIWETCCE